VITSLVASTKLLDIELSQYWDAWPFVGVPSLYSTKPPGPTQPGHPFVGRQNKYWQLWWPTSEKKRWVLRNSRPCYQLLAYLPIWLKALTVNRAGRPWLYSNLIGFNNRQVKVPEKGMSFHAKSFFSSSLFHTFVVDYSQWIIAAIGVRSLLWVTDPFCLCLFCLCII